MPGLRQQPEVAAHLRRFGAGCALVGLGLKQAGFAGGHLAWIAFKHVATVLLAVIVLFEQWGWRPLAAALAKIARYAPIAAFERFVATLPPYAALVVFGVPVVLLIPLKLAALYLITAGHAFSAAVLFIGAKIAGTAIVARLYGLTEPQLVQIAWLRQGRDAIAPRLHALHDEIRSSFAWRYGRLVKAHIKRMVTALAPKLKARVLGLLAGRTSGAL